MKNLHLIKRHKLVFSLGIILPLILYFIFIGYPLLKTVQLSFFSWDGIANDMTWVGGSNYLQLVTDSDFYLSLVNNIKWAVLTILFPVVLGLLIAVILQSGKVYFAGFFKAIIFLPSTMSLVMIGIMFAIILNPGFGALNNLLRSLHLDFLAQEWLGDARFALYTLIGVFSWHYIGLPMILYFSGIAAIPEELYESARLEGSSGFNTLFRITIPMLKPVTSVVVILTVINSLKAFDLIMVMTRGGPYRQTSVLGYYMYTETFWNYRYGYGAAISVSILLLSSVFVYLYLKQNTDTSEAV
jgi:multiple sugar transport system permease protein/raffinose/stachyose/melibiose transport system permease protein